MKLTHSISKYSIAIFLAAPLFLVGAKAHAETMSQPMQGKTTNLFETIRPEKETRKGSFKWMENGSYLQGVTQSVLETSADLPEEYDVVWEFSSTSTAVNLLLPTPKGKRFEWMVKGWSHVLCGMREVNGKEANENPTTVRYPMESNRRYKCEVRVRKDRFVALIDDKEILNYATDWSNVEIVHPWHEVELRPRSLGIWLNKHYTKIYSLKVREATAPEITLSNAAVEENKPVGTIVGSFSAGSTDKGKYDFTKGLVAYYPFDGNASDMSGNGNHGKTNGANLSKDRFGRPNSAYKFLDNKSPVNCGNSKTFNSFPITVTAWFNFSDISAGTVVSKYINASWNGWSLGGRHKEKLWPFYLRAFKNQVIGNHHGTYDEDKPFETPNLSTQQWYQIAFSVDDWGGWLYLDGEKVDKKSWTGPSGPPSSGHDLLLGSFKGQIDDVRIYDRALSAAEVTALHNLENKNFTFSLVDGNGSQDNKLFTIDANGALKTAASFDFENKSSHSIRVRATDENNGTVEKTFVIAVTDVAESSPAEITLSNAAVEENKPVGTLVGTFSANSADKGKSSFDMSRSIIAAGDLHTVFIKEDGSLWGMGSNNYGQLGDRASSVQLKPVKIVDDGVVAIAAGHYHTHFVKLDGSLWGMGRNLFGGLGDGTTTNRFTPVQILSSGVDSVAAGVWHSLILKKDGALLAAGYNPFGQLGVGAGNSSRVFPTQVLSGMKVQAMAGGRFHSAFAKSDGSLWTMGRNWAGQLGNGSTSFWGANGTPSKVVHAGVKTVTTGRDHTLFTKTDGSLWGMGRNNYGQLGDGKSGGAFEGYDEGIDKKKPIKILDANVTMISAGYQHSLFLMENGSLWGMGLNDKGQLGDGTTKNSVTPKLIIEKEVTAVVAGKNHRGGGHSLFVKKDGTLWSMGENSYGQLGIGSKFDVKTPVQVTSLRVLEKKNFTFSLVDGNGSQDNKLFTVDANGALKTAASFDFESKSSHSIRVRATDESNDTVEKAFVIAVTDMPENAAPVFTSSPTSFTRENETFAIDANASDPDGDALTFSLTGGDDREQFTINAATGALSFRSAPDFEHPADADGNNLYLVELSVSDGKLTASQLLAATVTDVNEGPIDPPPPPDGGKPKDPLPPKPSPKPEPKPEPEPEPKPIDLKAGLLAHYPYTGNAKDHSGNGHHLEVNGSTPTEDRFGMPNSAYAFDGKDDFMFADLEERKGDFTLSLWAKAENVEQSRYRSVINVHDKTPGSKHTCQIHTSGGRYPTYQFFSSNPESFALVKAEWQHLAVTVSGKVVRFYENGRRVYSQELEGGEANKFSNIIIGRNRHGGAKYHGSIDDIYVYERAISDAEVERLFNGGFEDSDGDGLTDAYEKGYGRYQIIDGTFTWKEAKADAEKRGGHLATFVTNEEWESFLAIVGGKDNVPYGAWMGGTDEKTEGVWEWITNEVWKYANWRRGEPNNAGGNEDHLHVWHIKSNTQKQWNDQRTGKFPYILEYGYYTDPTLADSDNDGVNDGEETAAKTDPNNPLSRPAPDKKAPKEQPGPPPPDRDFSKKVEELTKANEEKDKKIEELEKRIEAYAKSMAELNATNAALAKKVEDRDKTIASLRSERKDLRQQLVNAREDVANASQKLSTTEKEKELETAKKVANTPFVNGWIYDPDQGWLFTNADLYPSIYSSTTKSWHHYEPGSAKPRLFYSYKRQEWEAWDPMPEQEETAVASSQSETTDQNL